MSDLFATVLEVSGASDLRPLDEDSQSLAEYLDTTTAGVLGKIYSEIAFPNFEPGSGFGPCQGFQAARNDTFKYIRRFDLVDGLYDLSDDPWEGTNLINDPDRADDVLELRGYVDSVAGKLHKVCDVAGGKKPTGESCSQNSDCCSNLCSSLMVCQCPAQ